MRIAASKLTASDCDAPVDPHAGVAPADYSYIGQELNLFAQASRWKRYFASHLAPFIGRNVLEVGAGLGATTRALCGESREKWVCLEPDSALADRAAGAIASGELPSFCDVRVGTTCDLTERERFDTVLYVDVLEHIEDDAAEMRRAAGLLAPGGHVVTLSPAHQWLLSAFDKQVGHFRRYNRRMLRALTPPGLSLVESYYLDSVGLLASLGNALLLRQATPRASQLRIWDRVMVPLSRVIDPLLFHSVGKSVVGIWRKQSH